MSKDQNDQDLNERTSPDVGADFGPEGAFLDDWSVVEDVHEQFGVAMVRDQSPQSVDDVHRSAWLDLDEVADMASSVIIDLLDDSFAEITGTDFDEMTFHDLHAVIAESAPEMPAVRTPPPAAHTQEIELFELEEADSVDVTGIQIIDVDTGEIVPDLGSGFHLPDDGDAEERDIALLLDGVSSQIKLPRPWGAYVKELRDEILAMDDVATRAAYLFVFGQLVRSIGARQGSPNLDVDVAQIGGTMTRPDLLERISEQWAAPQESFFEMLDRLERLDESEDGAIAAIRRSSIARERLLDGRLSPTSRERLRGLLVPPESFQALVVKAVDAHTSGETVRAVEAWETLTEYTKGEFGQASISIASWLLQGQRSLLDVGNGFLDDGYNSRTLLLMMQREAVRQGERLQEARVLKRLVGLDVRLGKRLGDEGDPERRLKNETSTRLFRLSLILDGIGTSELEGSDVEGMTSWSVLRDAVSLNAKSPLLLRRLAAYSRRRGDDEMLEKALISLAAVAGEPTVASVIWERVADLARRTGAADETVKGHLQRALDAAPDCLPALISMGQHLIETGNAAEMVDLRAVKEDAPDTNLAWRRAELIERTKGDPVEVLSLYRDARDEHPASIHLFFCVERALARLADWRGLRTLYESVTGTPEVAEAFRLSGMKTESYRLAVEAFLEESPGDLSDAMVRFIDRPAPAGDDEELRVDQNILWRVIAREVDEDAGRALGRLELLLQASRGKSPAWRLRALVWYAHLVEDVMGEAERALPAYREIFDRAEGGFLRRWAVRGLLRTGDASWVAEHLAEGVGPAWVESGDHVSFRRRMAAELMGMSADSGRALDILERVESDDDLVNSEVAERATVLAIRSRQWVRAIPWMFRCYPEHNRPGLAELARHLGAAFDDAEEALKYIDSVETRTPVDPYVILCELELAYRARDWGRALDLIEDGLGTIAAGSIAFRAFLLEQAVLVAEWGARSDERAIIYLQDLWSLDPTVGSSPIFGAAAFLRTYARMGRTTELAEHTEYIRTNFTPSVAEALLAEPLVYDHAKAGAEAAEWYQSRLDSVPPPLTPYFRFMAATFGWMFGERDRTSVQTLADTVAAGDPTHRVGPFLLAIAYRHADMYASCERQLAALRTPGHSRPVQDWVVVRQLFHLAVTQNETAQALALLREDTSFGQFAWYTIAEELFARALRDPSALPALEERAKSSSGARNLRLEIAEIRGDAHAITALAEGELPEAIGQAEMRAARGESMPLPRWDVQTRHEELARSLEHGTEADLSHIVEYFAEVEEELLGSPWCPLRLVRGDLSKYRFTRQQQDRLRDRFQTLSGSTMGAEARLVLARQLLRSGRREDARMLMPYGPTSQLVSTAWSLFNFTLDPFSVELKTAEWGLDFWARRLEMAKPGAEPEFEYELGRHLELIGRPAEAIDAMDRSLRQSPRFLPAQVAAGRLLIQAQDWQGLASLWQAEMQFTEDVEALASVAFRLGYLWERRLSHLPDARRHAEDAYRRVLRVRPNHFPSLDAMLGLAYDNQNWAAAAEALDAIASSCPDAELRTSYLCELAAIRETHLEDLPGACAAYRGAFEIDPDSVDALLGVLRTDTDHHVSVDVVRRRFERGVVQRELRELGHHLFAMTLTRPDADALLAEVQPRNYAWLVSRLIRAVHQQQYDQDAGQSLLKHYTDDQTRFLVDAFERVANPPGPRGIANLVEVSRTIGAHPQMEGQLVRCMHFARRSGDLEALGTLAAVRARRSSSEVVRAGELTWLAVSMMLREQWSDALQIVEQLLEQVPNFLPAVKTAKFAADVSKNWGAVVRWFEVDAALTPVPEIAARDRLYASEVQRQHLGDFDAALDQLREVLKSDPTHGEAFGKLREILLTKRNFDELLAAYETRVAHTMKDESRAELLNQMGDVALNHMNHRPSAIGYFGRSLEIRPQQPRRLRILSELFEQEGRWKQAVVCHQAVAKMVKDPVVLGRLWRHIGQLYETRLEDLKSAKNAYAQALKLDPDATEVLLALARVCEQLEDYDDAAALLSKLVAISRDARVLLDARIGIARLQKRVGAPPAQVLAAIRDVLVHHPGHGPSIEAAKQALVRTGLPGEMEDFFQELTHATITKHGSDVLPATYEMARQLGHVDRAFCIASISRELNVVTPEMADQLAKLKNQRRWPSRAMPNDLTSGVLPAGLVAPFVEVLRRSRDGVLEGLDVTQAQLFLKKGNRVREPKNKATQLAFQWPALLGLELKDVHFAQGVPRGSLVHFDGGARLILDEQQWSNTKEPTALLAALGEQLAGWSMGIGPWTLLPVEAQQSLFIAMVSTFARGWAQAERSHLPREFVYPRVQRWLDRKGEKMAPYALEISGRFGTAAIRQQFELINEAQQRLACLLLDDPGGALKALGMLRAPEAGERPAWLFILGQPAAKMRKAVGVAAV